MKDTKNILQRALDYDLTEAELADFYSATEHSETIHDDLLAEQLAEDLFIPEKAKLLEEKRKGLEIEQKRKRFVLPLGLIGIAAGVAALVGVMFLMRPSSGQMTPEMVVEFSELSRGSYSPEVLASLERSDEVNEHAELVRAYENEDYKFVLENTNGENSAAEVRLLRARVLMDLGRYSEGLEIVKGIDEEELVQRDAWLWMRAEGEVNVGDYDKAKSIINEIAEMKLPGYKSHNLLKPLPSN